jgi:myo-inositol-1(or 4)-monophosphatase
MEPADDAAEAELLEVAVEAARAAAAELLVRWRRPLEVGTKSTPTDPVTAADVAAERAIRAVLARRRPRDSILGEEGGETPGQASSAPSTPKEDENDSHYHLPSEKSNLRWIVDPLDGTVNYMYGLPTFAVSVAVEDADRTLAAAVLDPVGNELFTATRSGAPLRNSEPIIASNCDTLGRALVATGFGYEASIRAAQAEVAARVIPLARDIRRAGAAALDMCSCASGRVDAYFERGVKTWDTAAGALICERAGLALRALQPDGILPSGIVVAPYALIDELTALVVGE